MLKTTSEILYIALVAIFIICTIATVITESNYENKFREAKPGISFAEIQGQWGIPDRECNIETGTKAIIYDKGFLGSSFVFILAKKDNTLVRTFLDD